MTKEEIVKLLDDHGWTFLKPVLADGSFGQQIDSTDIAEILVLNEYLNNERD